MSIADQRFSPPGASIKVIGIGGGGGNAINTMIETGIEGVEFVAVNTDVQSLQFSLAKNQLQIGKELTKGLGAGADPDIGRDAALEDRHEIHEALTGSDMVFITAGMGGGTGTGGASVIAQIARDLGALTVGVVTKPFAFEGKRRQKHAEIGIERLKDYVDTLITIPNQRLLQIATPNLSMIEAFNMVDRVLVNAVRGISDIINVPGTVNVDFADVKTVMSSMGQALMGIGTAEGEGRALEAANQAISSPLLEDIDIEGATGLLINITAGRDISLMEVNEACSVVQEAAHEDANIIFGAVIDESISESIRVTVIATGFPNEVDEYISQSKDAPKPPITKPVNPTRNANAQINSPKPEVNSPARDNSQSEDLFSTSSRSLSDTEELAQLTISEEDNTSIHFEEFDQHQFTNKISEKEIPPVLENHQKLNTQISESESDGETSSQNKVNEFNQQLNELRKIGASFSDEIKNEIDQALNFANVFDSQISDNEDNLDIPTYLRRDPQKTVDK